MTTPREMAWRLYQAAAETARDAQIVADRAARDKEAAADLHDLLVELEQARKVRRNEDVSLATGTSLRRVQ